MARSEATKRCECPSDSLSDKELSQRGARRFAPCTLLAPSHLPQIAFKVLAVFVGVAEWNQDRSDSANLRKESVSTV